MKIICVGMNYLAHTREITPIIGHTSSTVDTEGEEPVLFTKGDTPLRTGFPFFIPDFANRFDYEAEVVVRISRVGKYIAERFAHRYYKEVTIGIDFTARDLQQKLVAKGLPWTLAKTFDGSAALGDWMDKDALEYDLQELPFRLDIDNRTVQEGNTRDMIFSIDRLVSYASRFFMLKTGDMIFTGTPAGVGPIHIGQHLTGYLGEHRLLDLDIK
ncbi:fumarylacetoacetate hydrolase family protein [Porphyromonas macacae]|uniref:fumarylacetoacetate hydrolase family protein n=1 Tax=Porphyromonas macacae TaxID=28115 RepID=UPI00359F33C8